MSHIFKTLLIIVISFLPTILPSPELLQYAVVLYLHIVFVLYLLYCIYILFLCLSEAVTYFTFQAMLYTDFLHCVVGCTVVLELVYMDRMPI